MPTLQQLKKFASTSIDALGGSMKVAELFGLDERVVSNWKQRGLPPDTYVVMAPLLTALRHDANPDMWRQRVIENKRVVRPPRPKANGKASGG